MEYNLLINDWIVKELKLNKNTSDEVIKALGIGLLSLLTKDEKYSPYIIQETNEDTCLSGLHLVQDLNCNPTKSELYKTLPNSVFDIENSFVYSSDKDATFSIPTRKTKLQ